MTFRTVGKALLPVLSGVLVALALPGFGAGPLVFVALVPLFVALERRHAFRSGFVFFSTLFALDFRWVLTLHRFTPLTSLGYVLLVVYLALPGGFAVLFLSWLRRRRRPLAFLVGAIVVLSLLEFLRGLGPLGIGFSGLYLALARSPDMIQMAAYLGPFAITACIVAANVGIYLSLRERKPIYLLAAAIAGALLFLPALLPIVPDSPTAVRVAVVSSTVRQEVKLNARNLAALSDRYLGLGEEAALAAPDLIVFPESFLPSYVLRSPSVFRRFSDLARRADARVLFGTGDLRNGEIYNSVALLDSEGSLVGTYDMMRPVPFGEYIPGRDAWEAIGLGRLMNSFLPVDLTFGRDSTPLDGWGTPICFESTFPGGSRTLVRHGATALVTVTNDAWFARSSELVTHFAFASFRAVENRRWLVQAANGGVSGIVSPYGRVIEKTQREGVLVAEIRPRNDLTGYARWGDLPLIGLLVTAGLAVLLGRRKRDPKSEGE